MSLDLSVSTDYYVDDTETETETEEASLNAKDKQAREMDVLQSMFTEEELKVLPRVWGAKLSDPLPFTLRVQAMQSQAIHVVLYVLFSPFYPLAPPTAFKIESAEGLTTAQVDQARRLVDKVIQERPGKVCCFAVIQELQNFLAVCIEESQRSLASEMKQRQRQLKQKHLDHQDSDTSVTDEDQELYAAIRRELSKKQALLNNQTWGSDDDAVMDDHRRFLSSNLSSSSMSSFESSSDDSSSSAEEDNDDDIEEATPHKTPAARIKGAKKWKRGDLLSKTASVKFFSGLDVKSHRCVVVRETHVTPDRADQVEATLRFLIRLKHACLARYISFEWGENDLLLVFLPDLRGGSLSNLISRFGPVRDATVLSKYAKQLLLGVQFLHEHSIVHNQICLETVFLNHKGCLVLSDYGTCADDRINSTKDGVRVNRADLADLILKIAGSHDIEDLGNVSELAVDLVIALRETEPHLQKLLMHPFVADISTTIHGWIASSPPSSQSGGTRLDTNSTMSSAIEFMSTTDRARSDSLSSADTSALPVGLSTHDSMYSRYKTDFDEVEFLGRGGFGEVVAAKNRLDLRLYAVKKVLLDPHDHQNNAKILREVTTLSRIHHTHVVRYYQAWIEGADSDEVAAMVADAMDEVDEYSQEDEDEDDDQERERDWLSSSRGDISFGGDDSLFGTSTRANQTTTDNYWSSPASNRRTTLILYIQMEYCTKFNLRDRIREGIADEDEAWRLFRQILEGLRNIHSQGIIHRDLKPSNIFMDAENNCKIGDFGLATEGDTTQNLGVSMDLESSKTMDDEGFYTLGVGTPFYIAPEQLEAGSSYNKKIDMWALGIIFFELLHPFYTGMERAKTLEALREECKFPDGFEENLPNAALVIAQLLQRDGKQRPSARELLESELLPASMDQNMMQEAMRVLVPGSTMWDSLMGKLFSAEPDKQLDYTYDFNSKEPFSRDASSSQYLISASLEGFARAHGAMRIDGSSLIPNQPKDTPNALFLDPSGTVVSLPFDLTLPFARFVAHSTTPVKELKRFSLGSVYRKNPVGGHPRILQEFDFDIVSTSALHTVHDAEVMFLTWQCLSSLSAELGPCVILVNHHGLIKNLLEFFKVPQTKWAAVLKLFVRHSRYSSTQLKRRLSDCELSDLSVKGLTSFIGIQGDFVSTVRKIQQLLNNVGITGQALDIIKSLKKMGTYAKSMQLLSSLRFDFAVPVNRKYYRGFVFQAGLKRNGQVVAAGGRYDYLLSCLRPSRARSPSGVVGVSIAVDKLAMFIVSERRQRSKATGITPMEFSPVRVVVASASSKSLVDDRLAVCAKLWCSGISTEMAHHGIVSHEELFRICKHQGVPFVVLVRSAEFSMGKVLVRLIAQRKDVNIAYAELIPYLKRVISNPEPDGPQKSKRRSLKNSLNRSVEDAGKRPRLELEIIVLDRMASKQTKNLAQKIERSVASKFGSLSSLQPLPVLAIELPLFLIKEITTQSEPQKGFIWSPTKYPRWKDRLRTLTDYISKLIKKGHTLIVLYSTKDSRLEKQMEYLVSLRAYIPSLSRLDILS